MSLREESGVNDEAILIRSIGKSPAQLSFSFQQAVNLLYNFQYENIKIASEASLPRSDNYQHSIFSSLIPTNSPVLEKNHPSGLLL